MKEKVVTKYVADINIKPFVLSSSIALSHVILQSKQCVAIRQYTKALFTVLRTSLSVLTVPLDNANDSFC